MGPKQRQIKLIYLWFKRIRPPKELILKSGNPWNPGNPGNLGNLGNPGNSGNPGNLADPGNP